MNLSINDEQRALVDNVRRFVRQEILPIESTLDPDESRLPPEQHERLEGIVRQMGLFNLDLPEEVGGPGLDTVTRCLLAFEMSQHRAGLYAPCYDVFGAPAGLAALRAANEDQKQRYLYPASRGEKRGCFALTEPSGGSDPVGAIRTRAVRNGDGWVINGSKAYISSADDADYALVFARTGDARHDITAFIVDTDSPGFYVRRVIHTLRAGHYATELQFEDLHVPDENVLGEVGKGFAVANQNLSRNRIPYSADCIGVAVKAQELAVEYAKDRSVFGKPLSEHQGIQWMLVDNEHDIRSASMLVLQAAGRADSEQSFRTEAAVAKIAATEAAGRVVDRAMQIHGGMGVTKDLPLERWYRELRIRRIGEGPTEVQRMIISRELLKQPYRFFLR
jgi:acyl-CoA dehydrogenase